MYTVPFPMCYSAVQKDLQQIHSETKIYINYTINTKIAAFVATF